MFNPIRWYQFRKRLVFVRKNTENPSLNYYADPETDKVYVASYRYSPVMFESLATQLGYDLEPLELQYNE